MSNSNRCETPLIKEKVHKAITESQDTIVELRKAFEESLELARGQAVKSAQIIQQGLEQIVVSLKEIVPEQRRDEAEKVIQALEEVVPSSLNSLKLSVEETFGSGTAFVKQDGAKLFSDLSEQGTLLIRTLSTFGGRLIEVVGEEPGRIKEHLERLMKDNIPHVQTVLTTVLSLTQGIAKDAAAGIASLFQGAEPSHSATSKQDGIKEE
jgi:ferritin-like metal-binding protein YciE